MENYFDITMTDDQLRTISSNTASPQCASPSTLIWLISRRDIVR